jgi:predicted nuclease with RNAse H fold
MALFHHRNLRKTTVRSPFQEDINTDYQQAEGSAAPPSLYLTTAVAVQDLPNLQVSQQCLFVGLDLAPNEILESGLVVMDRSRTLTRIDKLYSDESIVQAITSLGPCNNTVVAIDMPKNLEINGKFRHEELKWHPFRLQRSFTGQEPTDRFSPRARSVYDSLADEGLNPMLCFTYNAKVSFGLHTPYRSRSPQGCRALQSMIKETLLLENMPTNLSPSSVLDAMIASYCAWLLAQGEDGKHYQLFNDPQQRLVFQTQKPY